LRLPDGYVCYLPPAYAPEVGPAPYAQNGVLTFGCLHNLMKLTPATLLAWAGLLRRLPNARLLLRSPQFSDGAPRDRVEQFFRTNGISPDRLQLMGRASHREFLATYHSIDLALDPFPYSGGLSTCEALYMGVPVLSLAGEIFAARHSASHLGNVGLSDWVVAHEADYIEKALSLASEPARLAELRSTLRERVLASPLCDAPRFGKNLGQALRMIWVNHCAKREA
jgi:predicted O-linked N-acetylglucosamine transferase (SPINDLY family)